MSPSASSRARSDWMPALVTLIGAGAAIALRPAVPIDETRYLEILRESLGRSLWLLQWNGEAYADKPPLLFWLARTLHAGGVPLEISLRVWPPLASAATVLVVARLGRRLGLPQVGWLQAALLMPAAYASPLLVDTLLVLAVWGALAAWSADRDGRATLWTALAFLAKGPVALVALVPLCVAFAPLRTRGVSLGRTVGQIALALVPVAAWALLALRAAGGGGFGAEILWNRWGARIYEPVSHAESVFFFVPMLLVGLLPCTPLLLTRDRTPPSGPSGPMLHRLPWALLAIFVTFSLFPGKQAHYLMPTMPGFALLCSARLESSAKARRWLRWSVGAWLAVLGVVSIVPFVWHGPLEPYGDYGRQLAESTPWTVLLAAALGTIAVAFVSLRRSESVRTTLAASACALWMFFAPIQYAVGQLVLPRGIAALLRERPDTDLILFRNKEAGLYNWLGRRDWIEELHDVDELAAWLGHHSEALVIVRDEYLDELEGLGLVPVLRDRTRGKPVSVLTNSERFVHAHSPWTNQRRSASR